VVGTADATHCGGADVGLRLVVSSDAGAVELPSLTWQNGACVNPTETHAPTWGALKQVYR
jgi:hypothetical protein